MGFRTAFTISLTLAFLSLLLVQHREILYYADDFSQGNLHKIPISQIIRVTAYEYQTWSGRIVSTFVGQFFLNGRMHLWKLINPSIITLLALLIWRFSVPQNARSVNKIVSLVFVLSFFLALNQMLAREVFYWVSGSVNYLWPLTLAMVFLVAWKEHYDSPQVRYLKVISLFFAFFAGNSNEQIGVVFFGLALFLVPRRSWSSLFRNGYRLSAIVLLCIGIITLYGSPGSLARYNSYKIHNALFSQFDPFTKVGLRLSEITSLLFTSEMREVTVNLICVFAALCLMHILFDQKKIIGGIQKLLLTTIFGATCIAVVYMYLYPNRFGAETILSLVGTFSVDGTAFHSRTVPTYAFWTLSLFSAVYFSILLMKREKSPIVLMSVLSAVLSQTVMLLISPHSPYRSLFVTVVYAMWGIAYLLSRLQNKFILSLITLIAVFLYLKSINSYFDLIKNYRINRSIMIENEKRISDHKRTNAQAPLSLYRLADDTYGFDLPYAESEGSWFTDNFLKFYGLPANQELVWEHVR